MKLRVILSIAFLCGALVAGGGSLLLARGPGDPPGQESGEKAKAKEKTQAKTKAKAKGKTKGKAGKPADKNNAPAGRKKSESENKSQGKPKSKANGAGKGKAGAGGDKDRSPEEWFRRRIGEEQNDADLVTPQVEAAIEKGLSSLARDQRPDGSWGGGLLSRRGDVRVAVTALSCLAFLAGGNTPGSGRYGGNVRRGLEFLLSAQRPSGYISIESDLSRIHGHGFATLFLAELFGSAGDKRVRRALEKAVKVIESSQTKAGGWGYVPQAGTWDEASTTIAQIQALRSAREAGVVVKKEVIERAVQYVHKSKVGRTYTDLTGKKKNGYTFRYSLSMPGPGGRTTWALTAAAVASLQGSGVYSGDVLEGGLGWMFWQVRKDGRKFRNPDDDHFFYAHFYASQAMYHAPDPVYWQTYYPKIRDSLLRRQTSGGAWRSGRYGRAYATSICTLILQIPFKFLPIFQR